MKKKEVSKNEEAGIICGFRPKGTPLDFPVELGYQCPNIRATKSPQKITENY